MSCSVTGCQKVAICKGFCSAHYQQQRQGKELKPLQQQFHGLPEFERFMKWVSKCAGQEIKALKDVPAAAYTPIIKKLTEKAKA